MANRLPDQAAKLPIVMINLAFLLFFLVGFPNDKKKNKITDNRILCRSNVLRLCESKDGKGFFFFEIFRGR